MIGFYFDPLIEDPFHQKIQKHFFNFGEFEGSSRKLKIY
jgi:hypothetical protein